MDPTTGMRRSNLGLRKLASISELETEVADFDDYDGMKALYAQSLEMASRVPKGLNHQPSSTVLGQRLAALSEESLKSDDSSETGNSRILRPRRDSSLANLRSHYDPKASPLAVSQQTSASSSRDMALRKASRLRYLTDKVSPAIQEEPNLAFEAAVLPAIGEDTGDDADRFCQLDLAALFPKPKSEPGPLLSPGRLTQSPSSTSLSSESLSSSESCDGPPSPPSIKVTLADGPEPIGKHSMRRRRTTRKARPLLAVGSNYMFNKAETALLSGPPRLEVRSRCLNASSLPELTGSEEAPWPLGRRRRESQASTSTKSSNDSLREQSNHPRARVRFSKDCKNSQKKSIYRRPRSGQVAVNRESRFMECDLRQESVLSLSSSEDEDEDENENDQEDEFDLAQANSIFSWIMEDSASDRSVSTTQSLHLQGATYSGKVSHFSRVSPAPVRSRSQSADSGSEILETSRNPEELADSISQAIALSSEFLEPCISPPARADSPTLETRKQSPQRILSQLEIPTEQTKRTQRRTSMNETARRKSAGMSVTQRSLDHCTQSKRSSLSSASESSNWDSWGNTPFSGYQSMGTEDSDSIGSTGLPSLDGLSSSSSDEIHLPAFYEPPNDLFETQAEEGFSPASTIPSSSPVTPASSYGQIPHISITELVTSKMETPRRRHYRRRTASSGCLFLEEGEKVVEQVDASPDVWHIEEDGTIVKPAMNGIPTVVIVG